MDELARAQQGDERAFRALVAPFERELRAHCYRMAGSIDDADDLLQESLVRIWRGLPAFEQRSSLRTWLHRVVASACIDRLKNRTARKRVEDVAAPVSVAEALGAASGASDATEWIGPCPASLYADDVTPSPEARYSAKESVSLAFLAALQLLPPKQRAALIACDVLGFSADECAHTLGSSAAAVHSALKRARESIEAHAPAWRPTSASEPETSALVASWLEAWNRADGKRLVTLLHDDATMSMPPLPFWLRGAGDIAGSIDAMVFSSSGQDAFRARPLEANGLPAVALYRRQDSRYLPYALHVLAFDHASLRGLTAFLDARIFTTFGLPAEL